MKFKLLFLGAVVLSWSSSLFAQTDIKEMVTMIKKNLADSKAAMKNYEWIESTTTYIKGEQKSVQQSQCYYSLDGKLTKVATGGSTAPAKTPGGLRGKIATDKKEEMADYIKAASALVQTYLPPDGNKIQQIYSAGKTSIQILEPSKKFKLSFPDYNKNGDLLSISVDKMAQKLLAADVNSYIDDPSQKVVFNITYNSLPDGTQYASSTTLDAQAKNLKIVIVNSGYKKAPK